MFTTFADMKELYFVYTLSHKGSIFYVGSTKDVVKRYAMHLNRKGDFPIVEFIKTILDVGDFPTLSIITYQERSYAYNIEETLIKCMSIGGQKLFNCQHFRGEEAKIYKTRKAKYKAIKAEQDAYHLLVKHYSAFYSPTIKASIKHAWQR